MLPDPLRDQIIEEAALFPDDIVNRKGKEGIKMVQQDNESDWRLFRQKISGWQERRMESLLQEYAALIAGSGAASDRFWALEKRINADKRQTGVVARMSRSNMYLNIINLLSKGAITTQDLDGFSDDLRKQMAFLMKIRD